MYLDALRPDMDMCRPNMARLVERARHIASEWHNGTSVPIEHSSGIGGVESF